MSKYNREIKTGVFVDVYDILEAFSVDNHAVAHAIKKLLAPGMRGHKTKIEDLHEAVVSINRAIAQEEQKCSERHS